MTEAPYHPSTNGASERLLQTFEQALRKFAQLLRKALMDFLGQYRRPPTDSRLTSCQLLNGRQIRTELDTIMPLPAPIMQASRQEQFLQMTIRLIQSTTLKQVISSVTCVRTAFLPISERQHYEENCVTGKLGHSLKTCAKPTG